MEVRSEDIHRTRPQPGRLIEVTDVGHPAAWVERAALGCLSGEFAALSTAPMSKTLIRSWNKRDLGHSEILFRITGHRPSMGFVGDSFNVVLATGHVPVARITNKLTSQTLRQACQHALELRRYLPGPLRRRPIGLLGLNPHAGEGGLIGREESFVHAAVVRSMPAVRGPLVPDVAFWPDRWNDYSVFVANYHDQGLIPFKMIHGQGRAAQVSLGIPIVRTSADHGTAKDIFGKNRADSRSMAYAIEWAARISRQQTAK
jgi:4-hydroxythreonine-4-phosphate dehydrogenase